MKQQMYWIIGILGVALVLSPFIFGYSDNTNALWSSIILGGAIVLLALLEGVLHDDSNWEYWLAGIVGVLAVLAPFVMNFSAVSAALWVSIVLGVIVALLAVFEVLPEQAELS
jgi:CDP-diglyceride synthetase